MLDIALTYGMTPQQYWNDDPRLFWNYEQKYKNEARLKREEIWLTGLMTKIALSSTILVATLAENDTAKKMPKYPDKPLGTPVDVEAERNRAVAYFDTLAKVVNTKK